MNGTANERRASRESLSEPSQVHKSALKIKQLRRKAEEPGNHYPPIPRPTTPLGFHGIRRKPAEFDSRIRTRHSN